MFDGFYREPPSYDNIRRAVCELKERFPFLKTFPIGKSVLGRSIYALGIGDVYRGTLFVGGVHGMEWLTTLLLFRFCEDILSAMTTGRAARRHRYGPHAGKPLDRDHPLPQPRRGGDQSARGRIGGAALRLRRKGERRGRLPLGRPTRGASTSTTISTRASPSSRSSRSRRGSLPPADPLRRDRPPQRAGDPLPRKFLLRVRPAAGVRLSLPGGGDLLPLRAAPRRCAPS